MTIKTLTRTAWFRFYEELNDFLPGDRRKAVFPYPFRGHPSVKDAIEALGVPHTEVDLVLVEGRSVDFHHGLEAGDRVSVYPVFESLDITPVVRLGQEPLGRPAFILDVHLGKLARRLRCLGFDAVYRNDFKDEELIERAAKETRIILTRDRGILKHGRVQWGYWVRSSHPEEQLREIVGRYDLSGRARPFTRCPRCNGPVSAVSKAEVADRLPSRTRLEFDEFTRCGVCGQIYWKGSHYDRLTASLERAAGPKPGNSAGPDRKPAQAMRTSG
jgi:uncharacterized protein with PIN domain